MSHFMEVKAVVMAMKYNIMAVNGIELKLLSSKVMSTVAHREYFSRRLWVKGVTIRPQTLQKDFWWIKRVLCF